MSALVGSSRSPQYSPDGRFWWDGQRWVPVQPAVPSPLAAGGRTGFGFGFGEAFGKGCAGCLIPLLIVTVLAVLFGVCAIFVNSVPSPSPTP